MELTDWVVMLAIVLIAIAFFCSRTPARWSLENRARRFTGARLLAQAACALWAGLLIVVRSFSPVEALPGKPLAPHMILAGAAVLIAFGCYWSIRGSRMLKPRRLFTAY
jgi:hypothetical protein